MSLRDLDHAGGVDDAYGNLLGAAGEPLQIGFGANDGERVAVDLGAVADVVGGFAHAAS